MPIIRQHDCYCGTLYYAIDLRERLWGRSCGPGAKMLYDSAWLFRENGVMPKEPPCSIPSKQFGRSIDLVRFTQVRLLHPHASIMVREVVDFSVPLVRDKPYEFSTLDPRDPDAWGDGTFGRENVMQLYIGDQPQTERIPLFDLAAGPVTLQACWLKADGTPDAPIAPPRQHFYLDLQAHTAPRDIYVVSLAYQATFEEPEE